MSKIYVCELWTSFQTVSMTFGKSGRIYVIGGLWLLEIFTSLGQFVISCDTKLGNSLREDRCHAIESDREAEKLERSVTFSLAYARVHHASLTS